MDQILSKRAFKFITIDKCHCSCAIFHIIGPLAHKLGRIRVIVASFSISRPVSEFSIIDAAIWVFYNTRNKLVVSPYSI